jgi:hypothetical protein
MDKGIKKKWVAALRSGNYAQGLGALCNIDGKGNARYCCLGVLIEEVEGEDVWQGSRGDLAFDGERGSPTFEFRKRVGINECINDTSIVGCLVNLNDGCGNSFEEIADFIEENL